MLSSESQSSCASASTMEADLRAASGDKSAKAKQVGKAGGDGRSDRDAQEMLKLQGLS